MHIEKIKNKIISPPEIESTFTNGRKNLKKLVFTNGCFDIIHKGHISYLSAAADLGSHLVVAINSDKSVKRIKGENRPLQDEETRILVMASFSFVDFVLLFSEDTPQNIISEIVPDVLVKGGDYKIEDIVGYDVVKNAGGEIKTIDFVHGYSSSSIINKI